MRGFFLKPLNSLNWLLNFSNDFKYFIHVDRELKRSMRGKWVSRTRKYILILNLKLIVLYIGCFLALHQWRSGSGRREMPGSMPNRACRPGRSEFFRGYLRNLRKYGLGSLRKTTMLGIPHIVPDPACENWTLTYCQPTT